MFWECNSVQGTAEFHSQKLKKRLHLSINTFSLKGESFRLEIVTSSVDFSLHAGSSLHTSILTNFVVVILLDWVALTIMLLVSFLTGRSLIFNMLVQ